MEAMLNREVEQPPCAAAAAAERPVKILCVDDQPANLLALEATLDDPSFHLVKAGSGQEALRCVLREDFALILMDVSMPQMDGFETAEFIRQRQRYKDTPIIFITASQRDEPEIFKGYSLGAVD
jgi:CheY-like chemotaxis protein